MFIAGVPIFAVLAVEAPGLAQAEQFCLPNTAEADKAMHDKDYKRALAGYNKQLAWAEKTCPKARDDALLRRVYEARLEAAAKSGDLELASRELIWALGVPPGIYRFGREDYDWAIAAINAAIKREPQNGQLYAYRAEIHKLNDDFKSVLADRNLQLKYAHNNAQKARAYYARGYARNRVGDAEGCLADLSEAIELDPSPGYYDGRALFFREKKKFERAAEDYTKALELDPKAQRHVDRAHVYKTLGRLDDAIADYTKAIEQTGYYDYLNARADLYRQSGKLDAAAEDYMKALSKKPDSARYLYGLLLVRTQQGDAAQAKRLRARLDKLKPGYLDDQDRARELAAAEAGPAKPAASPVALRDAWTMGEAAALAPMQHLVGKPNATIDKAWVIMSDLVRAEQKAAGQPPRGLAEIPEFDGPKSVQLRQAVAFVFRQSKLVERALNKKYGDQAGAVFAVSNAGYLTLTLNRMGVSNVNRQLGKMLTTQAPSSGLPHDVWADTVMKIDSNAKPEEVVEAWDAGRKAAREFLAKPEDKPAKKSEAEPKKTTPKTETAAAEKKPDKPLGLRKCDDEDMLLGSFDQGSTAPCQP
jgi:tetratricopeptide (TPR) repeat protein